MSKRALITGGAGFVAHHIVDYLLTYTDWEIVTLDKLDLSGNLNRLQTVLEKHPDKKSRIKFVYHDLRGEISDLTKNFIGKVDYILHLAAASHVDRSIKYPMEFVLDNVIGTTNILEFARKHDGLERFVYFSTDEIFGVAPDGVNYKERDRYNSTNPYSSSKAAGEELCVAYENTYGLPVFVTHCMNIIGERQHPEKFVPLCINKVRNGETVTIHSNSERTKAGSRFYIHALDVADAMLFLLTLDNPSIYEKDFGGAKCPKFNIVGKEEIDNLSLAQMIAKAQGKELKYELVDFHTSRPGHDLRYSLSGEYMKSLGWEPKISLEQRITEITEWSLNHPEWIEL